MSRWINQGGIIMNRNRHLSTKANQKIVHSGANHNEMSHVVVCPTYEKHVQRHLEKEYATSTRKKRDKMMARDRYIKRMGMN